MENKKNSNKLIEADKPKILAIKILKDIIKELIIKSEKYNISAFKFNSLIKSYYILDNFPNNDVLGYIDISANTYLPGGGLDYSSFTIKNNCIEIYTGFVNYSSGICDDSSWEKIYSSKDNIHKKSLEKALYLWAESFLMHLEDKPSKSLHIIDRTEIKNNFPIYSEIYSDKYNKDAYNEKISSNRVLEEFSFASLTI
jgi:hypothetical protein